MTTRQVAYLYPPAYHYRREFNDRLREILAREGVEYVVAYSDMGKKQRFERDTVEYAWGMKLPLKRIGKLEWQGAWRALKNFELVIGQQENRALINYAFQLFRPNATRFAFFGHGRNFQSRNPDGLSERWKRLWATRVDWWFAYTDETRRHVTSLGFPDERITVFNNAVDTSQVRAHFAQIDSARRLACRGELGLVGDNVAVFVGGLYEDKRLAFLIDAARQVRDRIPDFELVFVGGGPAEADLAALAAGHDWIKVLGPRFGPDKVEIMALGKVFLMPGLVGLAVVDAGAARLPTITTAFPWHSPEIAYVEDGVSGVIVADWQNPQAYADAVADLLQDPPRLAAMQEEAAKMAESLTIEAMADRFAAGVMAALAAPRR